MIAFLLILAMFFDPRVKPERGTYELDSAHGLCAGLFDYVMLDEGAGMVGRNLTTPVLTQSTGTLRRLPDSVYCTGGASVDIPSHGGMVNQGNFTTRVIHAPTTWPGGFTTIYDKGTSVGPSRELAVFVNTSGNISFLAIGAENGGTITSPASTTGMTTGKIWDFVLVVSNGTVVTYVNGKRIGSDSTFTALSGSAGSVMALGRNASGGGSNYDGRIIHFAHWKRPLAAAEIQQLYAEPYAMLRPILPVVYSIPVAAGNLLLARRKFALAA
jgi:hypothetical protein